MYNNCLFVLQVWESVLTLKVPDDEKIIEKWNRTITAVIQYRVHNVCTYVHVYMFVL